ncbi:MAG: TRAP transporter substrate-binding protein DctP [Alphaproteobacteria bacterium]
MIAMAASPVRAQETIRLTIISGFPPFATSVAALQSAFVPAIDAALAKTGKYRIDWNMAIGGSVVKPRGELEGVQAGLGDLGVVVTTFHPDRVPLYEISYKTPFVTSDLALVTRVLNEMEREFPAYDDAWRAAGQVNLHHSGGIENYILVSKSPIERLADLKGRKVGAAGPNLPWVAAAGATGVSTDLAGAYNALATGTYETMLVWAQAMGAVKLCEVAPHVVDAQLGATSAYSLTVNSAVWLKLPKEVQDAIKAAGQKWSDANVSLVVNGAEKGYQRCRDEFGMKYMRLDEGDRKAWAFAMPNIAREWAQRMDDKGAPGTKILRRYMDSMRASAQEIVRHWDRE